MVEIQKSWLKFGKFGEHSENVVKIMKKKNWNYEKLVNILESWSKLDKMAKFVG